MNDNTIIRIKVPAHLYESVKAKLMIKENFEAPVKEEEEMENEAEAGEEKTVTVTLNEYTGDPGMYDVGEWMVKSFPHVAEWFKGISTSTDPGQQLVDLGTAAVSLATVGTIALSVTMAVVKDDIKAAAKKLIGAIKGGVKEGMEGADPNLAKVIAKLPQDVTAKIAKQEVKETEANENLNEAKDPKKAAEEKKKKEAEAKKKEDEKKKKEAEAKKKAAQKKK
jgi:hypothetical protein